ncbi:MAG TPA: glucose 1-dehydrogenase [Limnochordia bacterium]|nr:glucose 1-dehydrogenase [Limnochordia bacterium]
MKRFEGTIALVTGGGQGIGRAVSFAFAREGAHVVVADIDVEAGEECVAEVKAQGGAATFLATDVGDEASVKNLMGEVERRFGRLHYLCNNAGISYNAPLEELPIAAFDRVIAVNLRGPLLCTKYALPLMRAAGSGSVVNIVSTRALMSEANTESYSASKGGLLALTHALAVSLGPQIRVNAISPGWIETSAWQKRSRRQPVELTERDHLQHPAGRVGKPEDIARAVLFLCDPEADFITGINLVIDGGMTIKMIYEE